MNRLIRENSGRAIDPLLFRKQQGNSPYVSGAVQILQLYHKAKRKLPDWVEHMAVLTSKSYEQASSQLTADFKAGLFEGDLMLNLTGGLGVDDVSFARVFKKVISVDSDEEIHEIASYNMSKMGVQNVDRRHMAAEESLNEVQASIDLVFVDPDRRPKGNRRSMLLEDCSPDVLHLQDMIMKRSRYMLVKLSPLFDLTEIRRVFHCLRKIIVLSVQHEVKEVLTIHEQGFEGEPLIACADISSNGLVNWLSSDETGQDQGQGSTDAPIYLYESGAAVVKAGMVSLQSRKEGTRIIGNSPFHLSDRSIQGFLGKQYRIEWHMNLKWNLLKKELSARGIDRAHVSSRDFQLNPTEILKKLKLPEGGDLQLIFTRDGDRKPVVYCCRRVS